MDQETALIQLLESGLYQCSAVFVQDGSLLASLFMMGLIGSASHCVGMCGPFVLSQVAARLEARPACRMREWHRLTGAALILYHLGRALTYAALGTVAATLTGTLIGSAGLRWVSAALLVLAALFLLGMALPSLKLAAGGEWWSRSLGRLARPLFDRPTGWRGLALGTALGFLPCGLLYGALAGASSMGEPLTGAFGMLAFWAGTVPSLFAVGVVGHVAGTRNWGGALLRYAPLLLVLNAGVLAWMAWQLVA